MGNTFSNRDGMSRTSNNPPTEFYSKEREVISVREI